MVQIKHKCLQIQKCHITFFFILKSKRPKTLMHCKTHTIQWLFEVQLVLQSIVINYCKNCYGLMSPCMLMCLPSLLLCAALCYRNRKWAGHSAAAEPDAVTLNDTIQTISWCDTELFALSYFYVLSFFGLNSVK